MYYIIYVVKAALRIPPVSLNCTVFFIMQLQK